MYKKDVHLAALLCCAVCLEILRIQELYLLGMPAPKCRFGCFYYKCWRSISLTNHQCNVTNKKNNVKRTRFNTVSPFHTFERFNKKFRALGFCCCCFLGLVWSVFPWTGGGGVKHNKLIQLNACSLEQFKLLAVSNNCSCLLAIWTCLPNTRRNNNVLITPKRRRFDVITSKWRRFDVITMPL